MIKTAIINAHNENYSQLRSLKKEIVNKYLLYGDDYLDTMDFAFSALRLRRLELFHRITFNIIRLWR